jgi:hypothetical protein
MYHFDLNNHKLSNNTVLYNFVNDLLNNNYCYIMCSKISKLRRDMNNGKKGGNIYQLYELKKINKP